MERRCRFEADAAVPVAAKAGVREAVNGNRALTSTIRGEEMPDHEERPPSTLAHGAVKSGDIERVRRDVDGSQSRVAHDTKVTAARKEEELRHKDTSEEGEDAEGAARSTQTR